MSDKPSRDRVQLGPEIPGGARTAIRDHDGRIDIGVFKEAQDGVPIPPGAELVRVGPESDGWRDVESIYKSANGPAQVATPAYREGYDRIFGGKQKVAIA